MASLIELRLRAVVPLGCRRQRGQTAFMDIAFMGFVELFGLFIIAGAFYGYCDSFALDGLAEVGAGAYAADRIFPGSHFSASFAANYHSVTITSAGSPVPFLVLHFGWPASGFRPGTSNPSRTNSSHENAPNRW